MKGLDHATHLQEVARELVEVAEKRAAVKADSAALRKARKSESIQARQKRLKKQLQELTGRIDALVERIGQPPPRRIERWSGVIPVTLHVESKGRKFDHPASTLDISDCGLRIVTTTSLIPGQTLEVYSNRSRLGNCRVVWVTGGGTDRPSEVGLEILH